MATFVPSSPARRKRGYSVDVCEPPDDASPRMDSAQISRSYSGLYGSGAPPMPEFHTLLPDRNNRGRSAHPSPSKLKPSSYRHQQRIESNLLPFELSRNRNTDWLETSGPVLLLTYLLVIAVVLLTILAFVPEPATAWTVANVLHGLVSLVYLHWIKGNPAGYSDGSQGEMNAMTTWEQIVSKPATGHLRDAPFPKNRPLAVDAPPRRTLQESATSEFKKLRSRDVLCVVPTLLAHAACRSAEYRRWYVLVNVGVWAVVMLAKLPGMNGVRILGINRTVGIDDGDYLLVEEETDDESSREEEGGGRGVHVGEECGVELKKER